MNSRMLWITGLLLLALVVVPALGFAAEHGGHEHGGSSTAAPTQPMTNATSQTPAAPAAPEAPAQTPATPAESAAPAPVVAPAPPAPPALKPIVITFSGDVNKVDPGASPAMVTVQDRYGVKKEIAVPAEAKIGQGTTNRALSDLKVGDKVTVEYTYDVATGKRTAQNITVGEAAAAGQ